MTSNTSFAKSTPPLPPFQTSVKAIRTLFSLAEISTYYFCIGITINALFNNWFYTEFFNIINMTP